MYYSKYQNSHLNDTNELIYKINRLKDIENTLMITKAEGGWRDKLGIWD